MASLLLCRCAGYIVSHIVYDHVVYNLAYPHMVYHTVYHMIYLSLDAKQQVHY